MELKSKTQIDNMENTELLEYMNQYLNGGSFKQFLRDHPDVKKGTITTRLKNINYVYNPDIKQFVFNTITNTDTEVLPTEVTEQYPTTTENNVFYDIKNILEVMSLHLTGLCDDVSVIKDHVELPPAAGTTTTEATNIDDLKPLKLDEDYITRAMKIYPSHMKRIKKLTKDSQLQQQQIVAILLDKALKSLGY